MLELLYNYFYELFYFGDDIDGSLEIFNVALGDNPTALNGINIYQYLSLISALVSFVIIVVLCCLFIGKLVKGVAHLINR